MTTNQLEPPSVARETSEEAAESAKAHAANNERIILALLRYYGPLTDDQIQYYSNKSGDYERPRRCSLVAKGFVEPCDGQQGRPLIKRKTPSGRFALAWRLTEKGRDHA